MRKIMNDIKKFINDTGLNNSVFIGFFVFAIIALLIAERVGYKNKSTCNKSCPDTFET